MSVNPNGYGPNPTGPRLPHRWWMFVLLLTVAVLVGTITGVVTGSVETAVTAAALAVALVRDLFPF